MHFLESRLVKKSTLVQTLPKYYGNYDVSFDVIPRGGKSNHYASIIHLTIGGNHRRLGDRIPAIWFRPGTLTLSICTSINKHSSHCINGKGNLPIGISTNIRVVQKCDESTRCVYQVFIHGARIYENVNTNPLSLENVRVYLSDPWHPAADVFVKNLKVVTTPMPGKILLYFVL